MANNIKLFNTVAEYEAAELVYPSVSYVVETDRVAYDDDEPTPTPSIKWIATYSDGTTASAESDSSSAITASEINLTNLVSVEIGDSVTSIGESAFKGCKHLTTINIPSGVTNIGERAFEGCKHLTTINLSGVTSIGNYAFSYCSALTEVSLDSIVSIGSGAFGECSGLTSAIIGSGCTSIGNDAFVMNNYIIPYLACLPTTPPTLGSNAFGRLNVMRPVTVYVPAESVDAYKAVINYAAVKPIP